MRISDWSSDVCSSDLPIKPLLVGILLHSRPRPISQTAQNAPAKSETGAPPARAAPPLVSGVSQVNSSGGVFSGLSRTPALFCGQQRPRTPQIDRNQPPHPPSPHGDALNTVPPDN